MADQAPAFRAELERQLRSQLAAGMEASQRLLPSGLVGTIDPASMGGALGQATVSLSLQPLRMLDLWTDYVSKASQATLAATARLFGFQGTGPVEPRKGDRRFKHPDWQANPWYYLLQQRHLLPEGLADDLVAAADVDEQSRRTAEFVLKQLVDAAAPTNQLWGNPAAIRRAYETGGQSLVRGLATFLQDLAGGRGPQKVPRAPYAAGWPAGTCMVVAAAHAEGPPADVVVNNDHLGMRLVVDHVESVLRQFDVERLHRCGFAPAPNRSYLLRSQVVEGGMR